MEEGGDSEAREEREREKKKKGKQPRSGCPGRRRTLWHQAVMLSTQFCYVQSVFRFMFDMRGGFVYVEL